eukprot:TRINITY_DN3699_c0_g1_i2.p1 TRINITY_DN3699_c0_g1~~TRINITY_DN3699_c0_g1_i2.p1  ORF type:complete len:638 (+),score=162.04 TRINITY_DN3699_c0_g1_i2:49-1914(+)
MVVVLAAAELFGSKLNRELEFAQLPSLGELKARAVGVFNDEISARKRPGMPAGGFNLHYIQLFDPVNGRWTELKSPSQLSDYCQIYLFQKDSWNKESQGPIPSPTRPSPVPPPYASRPIARTSSPMRKQQGTPQRRIGSPLRKPVTRGASPAITNTASPKREPISMTRSASPARSLATPRKHSSPAVSRLSPAHTLAVIRAPSTATRKSISPARMSSMSPTGPVAVPYNEKLTMLYTHMLGEKPQVGDEAFRQLFIKTRINIEPLMITKLFQQADANQDDLLSFGEWERFAEQYPTLIEAMYVRIRDCMIDEEQKADCEVFRSVITDLEEDLHKEQCIVNEAERHTANIEDMITKQKADLDKAKGSERNAKAVLDASRQETERARTTVNQRAADLAHTQEAQNKQLQLQHEAQTRVGEASYRAGELAKETEEAEKRLAELRRMVEEQEEYLQMARDREEQGHQEVDARNRDLDDALQSLEIAKNETQLALDRLSVSEQALTTAQAREEECGVSHLRSRDEVNKQTLKLEECDQELRIAFEREAVLRSRLADSEGILNAKKQEYQVLADANATHNMKRDQDEEKEQPLIEHEIRLRQQRMSLEAEEAKLRNEHRSFQTTTGR